MTTNIQFCCATCETPAVPARIQFQTGGILTIDGFCMACTEKVARKYDLFVVSMEELMAGSDVEAEVPSRDREEA